MKVACEAQNQPINQSKRLELLIIHCSAKMLRLSPIILARKVVVRVIDRSQSFDCFVSIFFCLCNLQKCFGGDKRRPEIRLRSQATKNADFKNFRGFVRTPRTPPPPPPPYGPVVTLFATKDNNKATDFKILFSAKI